MMRYMIYYISRSSRRRRRSSLPLPTMVEITEDPTPEEEAQAALMSDEAAASLRSLAKCAFHPKSTPRSRHAARSDKLCGLSCSRCRAARLHTNRRCACILQWCRSLPIGFTALLYAC